MNLKDPIGIIELGDANLKCLIFKINKNNDSEILSATATSSEGIYNDVAMNLKKASDSIRTSISAAEKKAKILLKKITSPPKKNFFTPQEKFFYPPKKMMGDFLKIFWGGVIF